MSESACNMGPCVRRNEGVEEGEEGGRGRGREGERTHTKNVSKHLIIPALRHQARRVERSRPAWVPSEVEAS